ncbi:MAG: hypothetical protein K2X55_07460, partial [Burkholderiaceae bacterium]|nr:hypothetical protein [Burkholderiaceae bacterium]
MSLLMQALKKTDRTRREALPDEDDAARPAEAFDGILALTPDDVIAGRVPPAPPAADTAALSLEAIEAAEARAMAPAGSVDEQVPALTPAIPAPHDPTPRQSRRVGDCAPRPLGQAQAPAIDSTADAHAPLAWNTAARAASPPPDAANAALPSAQARLQALTLQDVPPALMPEPHVVSAASPPNQSAPALGTEAIAPMRDFEADAAALGPQGTAAAAAPEADADAVFAHSTSASRAHGTAARARAAAQAALQDQPGRDPARVRLAML